MHRAAAATASSPSPSCCVAASSLASSRPRARAATRRHVAAAAAGINGDDTNDSDDAKKKNRAPLPLNGYARPLNGASYAANGASSSSTPPPTQAAAAPPSFTWDADAFPAYLQSEVDDFCSDWELALTEAEQRQQMRKKEGEEQQQGEGGGEAAAAAATRPLSSSSPSSPTSLPTSSSSSRTAPVSPTDPVWLAIRREAQRDAADEPLLSSFLYASILSHPGFARSLAFVLANRLSDATLLATELMEVFESVLAACPWVQRAALHDIVAVRERDPACRSYADGMLYFKGYQAVQVHRIAHELWLGERSNGSSGGSRGENNKGKNSDVGEGDGSPAKSGVRASRVMARMLQSRVSEVFAVDIHPAATLGRGLLLDHGTGVVIGETAVVGDNVSILQNVTLGGTGKDAGDRHPKVEDNVLIGAAATILGNITVGRGAQVAAGSLVLKPVPPRTAVAGSPAQVVGLVRGNPALRMQQWVASLDGKAAPAWESAMCPPSSSQTSSPQTDAAASPQSEPQQKQGEQQEEREINRRLYPRRAEEPSLPFVPVVAVKAKSPTPTTTPTTRTPLPPQQPKRPSPPPPSTPSIKPKQPPGKREQEPEFFI